MDWKIIAVLAGLIMNAIAIIVLILKVGRWQGTMEHRLMSIESWKKDHNEGNMSAFNRIDSRICHFQDVVFGRNDGDMLFITRREFDEFKAEMNKANDILRANMEKHFMGVSDLIKTYFDRAEKERAKIVEMINK